MIDSGKNQCTWVVPETTPGTFVCPAAADTVIPTGDVKADQDSMKNTSKEKKNTRSQGKKLLGPTKAGEWSLPTYVKPSGSLGVAPVPGVLLEAAIGKETIVASTSVTYGLAGINDPIPHVSILVKDGSMVKALAGCSCDKMSSPVNAADEFEATFSGNFMKMVIAGTDQLDGAITGTTTPVTEIPLKSAYGYRKYDIGAKINIGTDDNSGTGFTITAINEGANSFTISPACETDQDDGATIEGWTPDITEAGEIIHGAYGQMEVSLDGGSTYTGVDIQSASPEITNGFKVLEDEKTGDGLPKKTVIDGDRVISLAINEYFDSTCTVDFNMSKKLNVRAIKLPVGNIAGKRCRFEFPVCTNDAPNVSGDHTRTASLTLYPEDTAAGNDAMKLIFD